MRTVEQILSDPCASTWLKQSLKAALGRDPVDAANDAEVLARVLSDRAQVVPSHASDLDFSDEERSVWWGPKEERF